MLKKQTNKQNKNTKERMRQPAVENNHIISISAQSVMDLVTVERQCTILIPTWFGPA